jgi:hypothetical protein
VQALHTGYYRVLPCAALCMHCVVQPLYSLTECFKHCTSCRLCWEHVTVKNLDDLLLLHTCTAAHVLTSSKWCKLPP